MELKLKEYLSEQIEDKINLKENNSNLDSSINLDTEKSDNHENLNDNKENKDNKIIKKRIRFKKNKYY